MLCLIALAQGVTAVTGLAKVTLEQTGFYVCLLVLKDRF